jgi:hypothetical protein
VKAKSIKGNSTEEIKTALELSMADARPPARLSHSGGDDPVGRGFKPTLAFVFISIKQDIDAVRQLLDQHGITVFGASTGGEFIDGEIGSGTIAILLVDMNPEYFLLLLDDYSGKNPIELAKAMAIKVKSEFKNPAFIISCSMDVKSDTEQLWEPLIRAIESVTGTETIIWGGRAGDDFMWNETVVFTNQHSTKKGIVLLGIDSDKIHIKGLATSGQKPMGTEKTITKAFNNWVYEIDNQPATEMVLKYLGLNLSEEEAETYHPNQTVTFSVAREKGDPIIRGVGLFNLKEKSIYILGNIKEGDKVRFTLPPDFEIIEVVSSNAEKIKQAEMPDADALLMFSCVGRLDQFGPLIGDEIEGVKNVFNVPMAGFFTYGEYGRTKNGNNEFHSSTCCWVALKEK